MSETVGQKRPLEDDSVSSKRQRHEESLDYPLQTFEPFEAANSALEPSYRTVNHMDIYAPDVNELIDLQNEADIDIEALRRAMAEQEDLEPQDEELEGEDAVTSSDDEVDSDLEDEIDENDLPRLKDLQQAGLVSYNQQIKRAINQMIYSRNNIEPLELESDDEDDAEIASYNEEIHVNGSNGISPFDLPSLASSSLSLPVVSPPPFSPMDRPASSSSNDSHSETSNSNESALNSNGSLPNPFTFPPQIVEPVEYDITPIILKSSRVGELYQATDIPSVLSSVEKVVDESMMQIYDGEKVEVQGIDPPPPNSMYHLLKERQAQSQITAAAPPVAPNNQFEAEFAVRRPRASAQRARETIAEAIANEAQNSTITVTETVVSSTSMEQSDADADNVTAIPSQ